MDAKTIDGDLTVGGSQGTLLANRYRVIRQLGQGGMGSVWLAEDTQLDNREVAIKMLPSILVSNKRAYNQLKSEALVSLKLTHPNIAAVRAFEENGGNPFLVVDYIDGQTLDDYLADKGKLSEDETIRLLEPIASALDYAHGEGVVHRDVKPGNVMIRKDGHPFILDFGIAREIQETMTRVTGKLSSGTLMYMSPEQLHGAAPKSSQDVYSFAAMAYECLMGTPPFSRGQIEYQIEHDSPAPIAPQFAKCGVGIMAGLAKKPEDRPPNCAAVLSGGGHGVTALPAAGNGSDGNGRARAPREPRRWQSMMATLLVIAAVCGAGYVWHQGRQDALSRQAEIARLAEEKKALEAEKAEAAAKREQKAAEEALRTHEREPDGADGGAVDSAKRRKELADLANARTLIEIKRDRAQELIRTVAEYRREKDGFESHLAAFDAAYEKLKAVASPTTAGEIKAAADAATEAANAMELELKWLADNKQGRDDAKRIESEISGTLDGELKRFKAEEVASASFVAGKKLRQSGNRSLARGEFVAAGRDLSAAREKLMAALSEAKAFYVSLAVGAAKQRQSASQWEKCLAECEKALAVDAENAEAKALRDEANGHLVPSLRLVTRIGTREVEGAETWIGEKTYRSPLKWERLTDGSSVGGYRFKYSESGRKYVGTAPQWAVDWRGLRTMYVDLKECKGPVVGDVKTVTLPGGAKLELVYCPPGSFTMGSPADEAGRDDGETQHRVALTKGFWIGKYEVTQGQWKSVMGSNPSYLKGENRPVETVSWEDCQEFCRKAGLGLRLPTEAEWEYACRAGTTTAFAGTGRLDDMGWYDDNSRSKTHDVGTKRSNAWGIYDMHGNVWEWCSDRYGKYGGAATDPTGPSSGGRRVIRGGSWDNDARFCHSANRSRYFPGYRYDFLGFRVCCSAGPSE